MSENAERLNPSQTSIEQRPEKSVMVDINNEKELPKGVETWMRKVEMTKTSQVNDDSGQPILQPIAPLNPKVKLPVTRTRFVDGFKKKVSEAGRWLSEFIFRLVKINKGNVEFEKE